MNARNTAGLALWVGLALAGAAGPLNAEETGNRFGLSVGIDVETGDYGTGVASDSYSVAVTASYQPHERWTFDLYMPYLYQSASTTTTAGGVRFGVDDESGAHGHHAGRAGAVPRQAAAGPGNPGPPSGSGSPGGPGGSGAGPGTAPASTASTASAIEQTETQSGLGDIVLKGAYTLLPEAERLPRLRTTLAVKFPTADEDKGLGTGEYDVGVGAELSKWLGRWYAFAGGEYVFQGATDFGLQDFFTFEVGGGRAVTDRLQAWASLWGSTPPSEFTSDLFEVNAGLNYGVGRNGQVGGYLSRGLTDSSADYGGGVFAAIYF